MNDLFCMEKEIYENNASGGEGLATICIHKK